MAYSRFDDVILLVLELCQPLSDAEALHFMDVKVHMSENKKFAADYAAVVKSLYVKNFQALQNKTYRPQKFADVHKQIMRHLESKTSEVGLLPDYIKDGNTQNSPSISNLRAKIVQLKQK